MDWTLGCGGWAFKGGFTGMTSGANSDHIHIHMSGDPSSTVGTAGDITFEDVGCEASTAGTPPVNVFHISTSGTYALKGLRIVNCKIGQVTSTAYYVYTDDNVTLDGAQIFGTALEHPSSFFKINKSEISLLSHNLIIRSSCTESKLNARQVFYNGINGGLTKNVITSPVVENVTFTGSGLNDMIVDQTTLFTGSLFREFVFEIDGDTSPNTFKWSDSGGLVWNATGVSITGSPQTISEGVVIDFIATTGHTPGNKWSFNVDPFSIPNSAGKFSGKVIFTSGSTGGITGDNDTSYLMMSSSKSLSAASMYLSGSARGSGLAGTTEFYGNGDFIVGNVAGTVLFMVDKTAGSTRSNRDNTDNLGTAAKRWAVVYAGTGTINTSDLREKQQFKPIDDAVLRAWGKVNYGQFKFNSAVEKKGDGARWHFGLIAQTVKEAFESEGLNAFDYGLLCYDEWEDEFKPVMERRLVVDENGNENVEMFDTGEQQLVTKKGNRYGIRYEEALALECAYLRSKIGV
ncbi:MAG: tail fiber domain-containing protein [Magnetococcales bacterium]|nr:tail fiber domain-containing protein [Magnetococcales bacterium]